MPAACFSSFEAANILASFNIKPEVQYSKNYAVKISDSVTLSVFIGESYMTITAQRGTWEMIKSYITKTSEVETAINQINKRCAMFVEGFQPIESNAL